MKNILFSDFILFTVFLIFFLLIFSFSPNPCNAEETNKEAGFSQFHYKTVKLTGKLQQKSGAWLVDGKIRVRKSDIELHPSFVEIIGIFMPPYKGNLPYIIPIKIKKHDKAEFSIGKYDKPLDLEGKKSKNIHQHPIRGTGMNFDYFDSPMGQMVVYFKNMKDYELYRSLKPETGVILTGKLQPVFVGSKRPGDDKTKKSYFGFQMDVSGIKKIYVNKEKEKVQKQENELEDIK